MRRQSLAAYWVTVGAVPAYALLAPGIEAHAIPSLATVSPAVETVARSMSSALPVGNEFDTAITQTGPSDGSVTESCLASALCAVKQRIRWRTPVWTPAFCDKIAHTVLESSRKYQLSPLLLIAIMVNESTMNESAVRITLRSGALYAKDGGLMGLRCVLDERGRCTNGGLRGMTWSQVIEPTTNIAFAARQLAYWRDAGSIAVRKTIVRGRDGIVRTRTKLVRCTHQDHAFWAHYNHGVRYIDHGPARYYPVRVGSLYLALARTLKVDDGPAAAFSLASASAGSHHPWMTDRRVGVLCRTIMGVGPVCEPAATAELRFQN